MGRLRTQLTRRCLDPDKSHERLPDLRGHDCVAECVNLLNAPGPASNHARDVGPLFVPELRREDRRAFFIVSSFISDVESGIVQP